MSKLGLNLLVLTVLSAAPASAQEQAAAELAQAEQISDTAGTGAEESPEARISALQLNEARGDTEPLSQLSDARQSNELLPQLTRGGDRRNPQQLYRGGRTAQPLPALSRPEEGRTGAVAAVEGEDRCDPASRQSRGRSGCERVIETRSAEFTRPEANPLSPEQRLLIEQRNRNLMSNQAAARRLATNVGNPDELQDQAVASVALRGVTTPTRNEEEEQPAKLSSEVAAVVQAITNAVTNPQ